MSSQNMSLQSHDGSFGSLRLYRSPSTKQDAVWSSLLHSMLFDAR